MVKEDKYIFYTIDKIVPIPPTQNFTIVSADFNQVYIYDTTANSQQDIIPTQPIYEFIDGIYRVPQKGDMTWDSIKCAVTIWDGANWVVIITNEELKYIHECKKAKEQKKKLPNRFKMIAADMTE